VYAYLFEQVPAEYPSAMSDGFPAVARGARHSGEIEYVFQMLKWLDRPWTPEDFQVADTMSSFWVNFARSGDPNGKGLPQWPKYESSDRFQVMHFLEQVPMLRRRSIGRDTSSCRPPNKSRSATERACQPVFGNGAHLPDIERVHLRRTCKFRRSGHFGTW